MSQQKGARGGAGGRGKKPAKGGAEEKREDSLQAVVIADSFQDRFMPFALEKPRCLLPLANSPLLEYTLEFLAMNGVQDVFIYCSAHMDQIEGYIRSSPRWSPSSKTSPFSSFEFVRVGDARSVGDFLRDLDKRGLIGGDFILVNGDVVANISLDSALAAHRARREANRDAIMTLVLREAGAQEHRTKTHGVEPVFVLEPFTKRCLHFDEVHPLQSDHYLTLDPDILKHREMEIRMDLIDAEIDICTPEVLALWSESFDYELPRKNFLHGVLKDFELNGKLIYAEVVNDGYMARASNLQLYSAISRDVLGRWTYPFVPDCNLLPGQTYRYTKAGVYRESDVVLGQGCDISTSILGGKSAIGDETYISNSIIGQRCKIGNNVRIVDSFIWEDTVIGDGATITQSVLAELVNIGKGCFLPSGSLVSFGVRISDNISLPSSRALSCIGRDLKSVKPDVELLGTDARGGNYEEAEEDLDEDDPAQLQKSLLYSTARLNISSSSISTLSSEAETDLGTESDSQVANLMANDPTERTRLSSFASDDSAASAMRGGAFHTEAVNGLLDALREPDGDYDGAKLEFMALRLASDASDGAVRRAIAVAFARRAAELLLLPSPEHGSGGLEPAQAAQRTVAAKKGTASFLREVGVGGDEGADQVDLVIAVQKALLGIKGLELPRAGLLLAALLQQMYSLDVLEEDGILAWWGDARAAEGESMAAVRERCKVLVEWLRNADEESEEDDEDEDDD